MRLLSTAHVTQDCGHDKINQWDIFFMQVEDTVKVYIGDMGATMKAEDVTEWHWNGYEYPSLESAQTELAMDLLDGDLIDCEVEYEEPTQ